jgi:hypothetical protein
MSGKPSVPLLPPLSREALSQIHEIEDEVREALEDCTDPILGFTNPEKARQIVHTYLVAAIDVKVGHYSSLPTYQARWIPEIIVSTVNFFLGILHFVEPQEQLRNDLLRTAAQHLAQKRLEAEAIKNKAATPASQIPSPSPADDTIAAQLKRLRAETGWTIPALAAAVNKDVSTVSRNLSGQYIPYDRNLSAYEQAFSKRLKRQVVIKKMP